MVKINIDETDEKILRTCISEGHSITALVKKIGIAYPNMIKRINKLEKLEIIERRPVFVEPRGRQVVIFLTGNPLLDAILEKPIKGKTTIKYGPPIFEKIINEK